MRNNVNINKLIVILVITILGFIYQHKYINEFPSHIHAWAQSDRYALSFGFLDNGLNFFKPQTFVYNHQFPGNWTLPSETSITAVDFPIHDFIPAIVMKITGITSPWIFRLYILLYSFLGLFFLFKLSYAITKDYFKSVFVVVFAATSPVYVYYQGGFLPSIPSLSNAIIAMYFYYSYLKENKNKDFLISVLLLTLAALSRTTFAIPLIALCFVEFIRFKKKDAKLENKLLLVGISIVSIVSYLVYNAYLRAEYGSIFLNHILPPDGLWQVERMIEIVFENWFFQYFTAAHYIILFIVLFLSGYFYSIRTSRTHNSIFYFGLLLLTYLSGCIFFLFLMLKQFPDHDYYFLDTFFLPIILSVIVSLSLIPLSEKRSNRIITISTICLASIFLILQPLNTQEKRRETGLWDKMEVTIGNFKNSSAFLDSLNIPKNSKMLVIDAVAPNIPFILMQRKGFACMYTDEENIEAALKWKFDYIVIQNRYFISEVYKKYPAILSKLTKIADNGKISICTLTKNNKQSLLDFAGLNKKKPLLEKQVTFEITPDSSWQNFNPSKKFSYSGASSGYLSSKKEYGLTYKTKNLPELKNNPHTLFFSSAFLSDTAINCEIVVSINSNGQNVFYKSYAIKDLIKQKGKWQTVSQLIELPKLENENYEFALFIWNTGKSEFYYDDFTFSIYESLQK